MPKMTKSKPLDLSVAKASRAARRFRDLLEAAPDAMVVVDQGGKIVLVNTQTERLFGYQRGEMLGRAVEMFVPVRLRERHRLHRRNFVAEPRVRPMGAKLDLFGLRKDGTEFPVEISLSPVKSPEGILVTGAIRDITDRKQREEKLREYERAVEDSGEMICVVDRDYRYLIANRKFVNQRNMRKEEVVGRFVHEVLDKEVFENVVKKKMDECFQGKIVRYEMKYTYPDLGQRELSLSYYPIEGTNGIDRVVCILQDITDRKQMEEALSCMSRKLIESQEQDRSRIGRELHDDINQRLALLALDIEQFMQGPPDPIAEINRRLAKVRECVFEIGRDVQSISHQLHSPQLEILGIVGAMRSLCKEFSARQKVTVEFKHDDIPKAVSHDVSLCLFRVLQEALHNAVKHSNSRHYKVNLSCSASELHLTVSDPGTGFDAELATRSGGLGLVSMKERVRLVKGTIVIKSTPMGGTTIDVRVPFISEKYPKTIRC